jgi:hypothetical protein
MYTRMATLNRNVDRGRLCETDKTMFNSVLHVGQMNAVLQVRDAYRKSKDPGRMNELECHWTW